MTKVPEYISLAYKSAIYKARTKVRAWLEPYGYSVILCNEEQPDDKNWLGQYEAGSVFSGLIEIRVSKERIYKYSLPFWRVNAPSKEKKAMEMAKETAITFYHEVGHAIMEQIIDWYENIPEIREHVETKMMDRYFDVFDDSNVSEEALVEVFAHAFHQGKEDETLRMCFNELNNYIKTL